MITDGSYLSAISPYLNDKYFHDSDNKTIARLIKDYFERNNKAPTLTEIKVHVVEKQQQESYKKVAERIKKLDKQFDEDELYRNTEQFFKEKAVFYAVLSASEKITKADESGLDQIVNEFQEAVSINLTTSLGFNLRKDIDKFVEDLKSVQNTISTGWKWLDDNINGGFQEQGRALYVFCGVTNIGKSIFLGAVANAIARQNKNVLLISLEMPEHMYVKRICSQLTKIPLNDMVSYADAIPQYIEDSLSRTSGNILVKEFPPSTITVPQLDAYINRVCSVTKVDAIVLDYVNLMKGTFGNNSYERIKDVTEKLRALTYKFNCPIISATQLNRSAVDSNNPGLDAISESFGLAATADCLFNIWQEEEDNEMGVIRLGIIKNRFGPRCVATALKINYNTLTLTEDAGLTIEDPTEMTDTLERLKL